MVQWRVGGSPSHPQGPRAQVSAPTLSDVRGGYYCQNPNQSGDTNGVGYALLLHPDRRLMFFFNHDEVRVALGFIRFYADLGIHRARLIAVVCDQDSTKRPALPSSGKRQTMAQAMTVWSDFNPLKDTGPTTKKATNQFKQRKQVMEQHLGPLLRARWGELSRGMLADPQQVEHATRDHKELHALATVVPWGGATLSGNQLYQAVSDPERKSWVELEVERLLPIQADDRLFNVGQTTQDVMDLTRRQGTETIQRMRAAFRGPNEAIDAFTNDFVGRILNGPGRPILVLVWIRGVSGSERAKLDTAGIGNDDIREDNFGRINTAKRNPHHVMTAQLYDAICRMTGELATKSRRPYQVCPIGDEIYLNQYDRTSPRHVGAAPDNLVNFFTRLADFGYALGSMRIGPRRFAQSYFLHRLATHPRLGGVVQIGLRSGAMETLMYLGFPTIYIEDQFEESGPRMAAVTSNGASQAATDLAFLEAKARSGQGLGPLRAQREASQIALLPAPLDQVFAERHNTEGALDTAAEGVRLVHAQRQDPVPPFPFFLRLLTRNLIGLNPVGEGTVQRLAFRYGGTTQQARGSLTEQEMELLKCLTAYCGEAMSTYQEAVARGDQLERPEHYLRQAFLKRGGSL